MKKLFSIGLAILLMASASAFAQTATGNVYGKATDSSGAVLPGASVTVSGEAGSRTTVTGADGTFRFLNLSPGDYTVTVSLQGFGAANRRVTVQTGQSASLDMALKVGGQAETIEVVAEAPLVDVKKRGTSANLTSQDLKDMPTARDPWGILNQVPGAMVDRVNIAGNENGQQASFTGKGSNGSDNSWSLDGLVITDMSAAGASPGYYDFGAFQEINVTTGGADLTTQTGGFGMNMVTKRGTNQFHGGGRYLSADDRLQSSNLPDVLKVDPRLKGGTKYCEAEGGANAFRDKADHLNNIKDYGVDLGGPILKDKLWFYGTYGKQHIQNCRLTGTADETFLSSYNAKLNWQATSDTMVSAFYFLGAKQKFGRGVGYPVTETDDFTWNQDNAFTEGGLPGGLWKLEVNHTFSPSFFVSAKAAYFDTGFGLFPRGGKDKSFTIDYAKGEAIGSYETYQAIRPQKTLNVDGSYFFQGMGGNNELKFGFGYRTVTTNSISNYNGGGLSGDYYGPGTGGGDNTAYVYRDAYVNYKGNYASLYLGDVFTKDRFTLNFGLRADKQDALNLPGEGPANVTFPDRLPALKYGGSDKLIKFTDVSPRFGMSYALDEARKTVVRLSLARYASALSFGNVNDENPLASAYIAYPWNDLNADRFVQKNEVGSTVLFSGGIDPAKPTSASSPDKIDRDLKNRHDIEAILGLDHELGKNFAVGGAFTYRSTDGYQYVPRLAAACPTSTNCAFIRPNQYTALAPVTRSATSALTGAVSGTVQPYAPLAALVSAGGSGRYRTNFDGYSTKYAGFELTLNKRLANRWGGRVAFTYNNWTENFDGDVVAFQSSASGSPAGSPMRIETSPLINGGPVSLLSGGSGKASFYSSFKWQLYVNGIVQLPGSFDLSTQIFSRQGGAYPYNIRTGAGLDGTQSGIVGGFDSQRYDTVVNVDFRLARNSKIGRVTITPSIELFNALNNDVTLSQARSISTASTFGRIEEIISPRVFRIGARLSF